MEIITIIKQKKEHKIKDFIVYEDSSIIIFDKPQGLATTKGTIKNLSDTVFNSFPKLREVKGHKENEGGLLNRLDNETGGLVLFAKSSDAFLYYFEEMKNERIEKIYTALVDGIPEKKYGFIDVPLAHHPKNKKKMVAVTKGSKFRGAPRKAFTEWRLLRTHNNKSLLEIKIRKGARHQIRVHLTSIGLPIVGDKLYSKKSRDKKYKYHLLYANGLIFTSYENMKTVEVFVEVPFLL